MDREGLILLFIERFKANIGKHHLEIPSYTEIFFEEKLIAESFNQVEKDTNTTKHSEILCIEKTQSILGKKFLEQTTLITLIEPCIMCSGAIIQARIPKIIYLLESKKIPGISSMSVESIYLENHFPEINFQFSETAELILKNFFKEKLR